MLGKPVGLCLQGRNLGFADDLSPVDPRLQQGFDRILERGEGTGDQLQLLNLCVQGLQLLLGQRLLANCGFFRLQDACADFRQVPQIVFPATGYGQRCRGQFAPEAGQPLQRTLVPELGLAHCGTKLAAKVRYLLLGTCRRSCGLLQSFPEPGKRLCEPIPLRDNRVEFRGLPAVSLHNRLLGDADKSFRLRRCRLHRLHQAASKAGERAVSCVRAIRQVHQGSKEFPARLSGGVDGLNHCPELAVVRRQDEVGVRELPDHSFKGVFGLLCLSEELVVVACGLLGELLQPPEDRHQTLGHLRAGKAAFVQGQVQRLERQVDSVELSDQLCQLFVGLVPEPCELFKLLLQLLALQPF